MKEAAVSSWRFRVLRSAEHGESESFEFTVAIVPIVTMILLIGFATLVRSSQMPAWTAASECARAAIATEDEDTGRAQGEQAARDSLAGNFIVPESIDIRLEGDWTPDSPVMCRVIYDIDVSRIPSFSELLNGRLPMRAEVTLRTEPYKSRWR
jgi:hypothetical protein